MNQRTRRHYLGRFRGRFRWCDDFTRAKGDVLGLSGGYVWVVHPRITDEELRGLVPAMSDWAKDALYKGELVEIDGRINIVTACPWCGSLTCTGDDGADPCPRRERCFGVSVAHPPGWQEREDAKNEYLRALLDAMPPTAERDLLERDLHVHGISATQDGKRIDPRDLWRNTTQTAAAEPKPKP